MKKVFLLLQTECQLEFASGKRLIHFIGLGILLSMFSAIALQGAFLEPRSEMRVFPSFFALLLLCCNLSASQEVLSAELKNDVHESLRLHGVSPSELFTAKLIISSVLSLLCALVICCLLAAFLEMPSFPFAKFSIISLLAALTLSSLSLLISGITARSRASSLLFALILLPLLFPVFFCCTELSSLALETPVQFYESFWFSLLCGLAVVYSLVGSVLFEFTIFRSV